VCVWIRVLLLIALSLFLAFLYWHSLFTVCYRGKRKQGAHRNVTAERVSVILQHMLNIKPPSASLMCSQSSWDQQLKRPSAARKTLSWP